MRHCSSSGVKNNSGQLLLRYSAIRLRRKQMKAARLAVVVAIILGIAAWLHAQTSPNIEKGWKPYGSYDSSHLDTVNLMNVNLMLHLPIVPNAPQRGYLKISYSLHGTS